MYPTDVDGHRGKGVVVIDILRAFVETETGHAEDVPFPVRLIAARSHARSHHEARAGVAAANVVPSVVASAQVQLIVDHQLSTRLGSDFYARLSRLVHGRGAGRCMAPASGERQRAFAELVRWLGQASDANGA